jgi:transposase
MIGEQDRWQEELFVACPLSQLIDEDHILKRVDKVLDLRWLRKEVRPLYEERTGRPSIDPEAAVRLMLAGYFHGIVHDRKLMREAKVNIAIRWFAGYKLHERLPDHSSLTRIRQRWGAERFKKILKKTITHCIKAGLVDGETVHFDATLIRADVSWESMTARHVNRVWKENQEEKETPSSRGKRGRPRTRPEKVKKQSTTDPEASLATSSKDYHMEPSYKQHTAVDDKAGIIVDISVTTGETSEGSHLLEQVAQVEETTGKKITRVTADRGYAHSKNYEALEARGTDAVIPPQKERSCSRTLPQQRFKYDAKHKIVRCPGKKRLRRSYRTQRGWVYRARTCDCRTCPLKRRCLSPSASSRTVLIVDGYEALMRARRTRHRWDESFRKYYTRHKWQVEGVHGEGKTQHGLRRAVRRGTDNISIQAYLTAAVINLKRLAAHLLPSENCMHTLYALMWRNIRSTLGFSRIRTLC